MSRDDDVVDLEVLDPSHVEPPARHRNLHARRPLLLIAGVVILALFLGGSVAVIADRDRGMTRADRYPADVHALGMGLDMSNAELSAFGRDECQAAREATRDHGAALLRFKGQHVAAAYNSNNRSAIEDFRILFRATGHLLCPELAPVINHASGVLL